LQKLQQHQLLSCEWSPAAFGCQARKPYLPVITYNCPTLPRVSHPTLLPLGTILQNLEKRFFGPAGPRQHCRSRRTHCHYQR
jgi:hypothetical protein